MREITCDEYVRDWLPRIRSGGVVPVASATNFMGDGLFLTEWAWADDPDQTLLRDERQHNTPDGWYDGPESIESCRHWLLEDGDDR